MSRLEDAYTYIELEEALALYDEIKGLPAGGARDHLRDERLLESALLRPTHAAYYMDADLAYQAATLLWGVAENQPFIDGNKRIALVTALTFLEQNGVRLEASDDELFDLLIRIAHDFTVDQVAEFIRPRLSSAPPDVS